MHCTRVAWLAAVLVPVLVAGPAHSQLQGPAQIPFNLLDNDPRGGTNTLTYCIDDRLPGYEVHERIGVAVAEALLVDADFYRITEMGEQVERFVGVPDDLRFVLLSQECDAFLGAQLGPNVAIPNWGTVTQAYLETRYVLATTRAELSSFTIVHDTRTQLGLPIGGRMNVAVSYYFGDTNRRVFDDDEELIGALRDHVVEAGIVWGPTLLALTDGDPAAAGFFVSRIAPVPDGEGPLAMELFFEDTALRVLLDQTIAALIADGTIAAITAEFGYDRLP